MLFTILKKMSLSGSSIIPEVRYKLSDILPVGFSESVVNMDEQVVRDDAFLTIQNVLNQSSSSQKVILDWDKSVSISDTLRIGSNTQINLTNGKGIVLRNSVSKPIFKNRNHRPSGNANIVDRNIKIYGEGILNGNASQQARGTSGQGMTAGIAWHGVRDLDIDGLKIFNHKMYATIATNVVRGAMRNFETDIGYVYNDANMDGVHWDGHCTDCIFENGRVRSNDDAVVCNADDGYTKWPTQAINGNMLSNFYDISFNGPATNLTFKNIHIDNGNTSHGFAIRLLSILSRVDNIKIENIYGLATDYALLIDTYAWYNSTDFVGKGNVGDVFINGLTVDVNRSSLAAQQIPCAKISLACSIDNLIGIDVPQNGGNLPFIIKTLVDRKGNTLNYGSVNFDGINY